MKHRDWDLRYIAKTKVNSNSREILTFLIFSVSEAIKSQGVCLDLEWLQDSPMYESNAMRIKGASKDKRLEAIDQF